MQTAQGEKDPRIHKVIILGTGPAGLTAALYTARAQLAPVVLHGTTPGGQLTTTTEVENFPGFIEGIDGNLLIENMQKQAERFGAVFQYGEVQECDFSSSPIRLTTSDGEVHLTRSLIISTGARPRKLGLSSEDFYWSKGVTSCATCDGFFYKGMDVCVVGGGDSAMEEAAFLTRMCSKVYLIHRRDAFRASKVMVDRVKQNPKIELVLDTAVEEVLGDGKSVTGIRIKNFKTNEIKEVPLKGVFVAIGHIPNTDFLKGKIDSDENGYLITKGKTTYTNLDGVFVCGDCQDHTYRQAITAAGSGCQAAIDAERWLEMQGH
ncbi:hypothetical protein PROFUN_00973 [Planoprotostelium fungivorum]|uniref:Thioredoxin reductase n=1 Tax=Planoprotostelium fungivorum TaxID=1890364 RepID=A0A2P6N4B2_9EUKA|nr:hypothetical protein PROFUN_00973 [Planoprotostelium fungivorum]